MPTSIVVWEKSCLILKIKNFSKYNYLGFSGQMSLTIIAELLTNASVLLKRFRKPWWEQYFPNYGPVTNDV